MLFCNVKLVYIRFLLFFYVKIIFFLISYGYEDLFEDIKLIILRGRVVRLWRREELIFEVEFSLFLEGVLS